MLNRSVDQCYCSVSASLVVYSTETDRDRSVGQRKDVEIVEPCPWSLKESATASRL